MATMAVDPVFVDTNILVYAHQALSPYHAQATAKLHALSSAGHALWISRQVLREYLAVMSLSATLTAPLPMTALIADVQSFQTQFLLGEDGPAVTLHLLNLLSSIVCAGKQIHDANIVATMMAYSIPKLLTHNVADFTRFAAQISVIPLVP